MSGNGTVARPLPSSDTGHRTALNALDGILPLYFLPQDPLADEVLIPGFQSAAKVRCMVGFFSSEVLASLAPGLATYINTAHDTFQLVISPLLRPDDLAAIEEGVKPAEEVASEMLGELIVTENLLARHTLKCLSWLIRKGRIEIKIALMKDALFHPKVWLFQAGGDVMAVHGSSNVTHAGIHKNIEQIAVSKSWQDANQRFITEKLDKQFTNLWRNEDKNCIVVSMPDAIRDKLLQTYSSDIPPAENELSTLYEPRTPDTGTPGIKEEPQKPFQPDRPPPPSFSIPAHLRYEDGPFEHQGKAVNAWCEAGYSGVLEMATGSGKTITAMICAHRTYDRHKPLLVVVAAPYIPLIQQWCDEISPFSLRPVNLTLASGANQRANELGRIRRRFRNGTSDIEVVVVSHRTLCAAEFRAELEKFDCARLLIADEAHNLGAEGFLSNPPNFFEYRLGLSATPVRQYDQEGTDALFAFFGDAVFRFTLEEAIGRCLVEYDYFVHPVELTSDEMDEWYDLTAKIKKNSWRRDDNENESNEYLTKLYRDRRVLLEVAHGKLAALESALTRENLESLRHTLIYTSDKAPEQLEAVNALLNRHGILFHQLTHKETSNREKSAQIIQNFQEGALQILTAKRVLDEGVNIPQIKKAFILASTTVERQWVQRRGRLLRSCRETGKMHSEIHDFIAMPPDLENIDDEAKTLVRSELQRVLEFASLARNAGRSDGPLEVIHKLVHAAFM